MKFTLSSTSDAAGLLLRGTLLGCCITVAGPLLGAVATQEEEPELVTDRPDQTESTAIVPVGRVQFELGASLAGDEFGDDPDEVEIEARQLGATLVRIGLSRRFELRLGWEGWLDEEVSLDSRRESEDGPGDAFFGAKLRLSGGDGPFPAVALLVHSSVPIGDQAFTTDRFDGSFRLSVSHDLANDIGLGYNVGVETQSSPAEGGGESTLATAIYTLSVGIPAGERLGFFVEAFGEIGLSADGPPANSLDAGATYLLRANLQLDAAAGVGISEAAADWFAGVGVSVRLPR